MFTAVPHVRGVNAYGYNPVGYFFIFTFFLLGIKAVPDFSCVASARDW